MAGVAGTDLNDELNRLAQGGSTYLPPYLDAAGAANKWAGTVARELVGALNAKAGTVGLELEGVCNALAGTTGLDAVTALRKVNS